MPLSSIFMLCLELRQLSIQITQHSRNVGQDSNRSLFVYFDPCHGQAGSLGGFDSRGDVTLPECAGSAAHVRARRMFPKASTSPAMLGKVTMRARRRFTTPTAVTSKPIQFANRRVAVTCGSGSAIVAMAGTGAAIALVSAAS